MKNKFEKKCKALEKDLKNLMRKYEMDSYYLFFKKNESSDQYKMVIDCTNITMTSMIANILFLDNNFEFARDNIINNALRYINPFRLTKLINENSELVDIPFVPEIHTHEKVFQIQVDECR